MKTLIALMMLFSVNYAFATGKGWECQCYESATQDAEIGGGFYDWTQATNLNRAKSKMKRACIAMYPEKKPVEISASCIIRNHIQE